MSAIKAKKVKIIRLDEVNSTQQTAREWLEAGRIQEETLITARYQRAGKGRGTATWDSRKDENLLFTWVLFPEFLPPERQFCLSMTMALAVADLVAQYMEGVTVKWPNDIYTGDKKVAGILIENNIQGNRVVSSLTGVGINVNQTEFDRTIPNPASLRTLTGRIYDMEKILKQLINLFGQRYEFLKENREDLLLHEYITRLYLYDEEAFFKTQAGRIKARITGVDRYGRLLLADKDGSIRAYAMEEVKLEEKVER